MNKEKATCHYCKKKYPIDSLVKFSDKLFFLWCNCKESMSKPQPWRVKHDKEKRS